MLLPTYLALEFRRLYSWVLEEDACSPRLLYVQKDNQKTYIQLKTIYIMRGKTTLSLRLSSIYYAFRCKKYICQRCYMSNRFGFTVGICNTCKGFVSERDVFKYGLNTFYDCKGFLLNKNISFNEHRFNGTQKNLPRDMVNTKQPIENLGSRHRLNMMKSCVRTSMGTVFQGVGCLRTQII